MKFGLFVGAKIGGRHVETSMAGDSLTLSHFLDYVQTAERVGFENLFVVEHHFTGAGQISASLNLLSYVAAKTTKLRLGTAVVVLPWHNPALLAEQVTTLDVLSDGRFDFGIGKGYRPDEFEGFCMPMDEAQGRYEECVAFLKKAWTTEGRFSFEGRWHSYENIVVEPAPMQQPHPPIWRAASSIASAEEAARSGFSMLLDQLIPAETVAERVTAYRNAREECGLDPEGGKVVLARGFRLVDSEAEANKVRRATGEVLERVHALRTLGVGAATADERVQKYVESRIPLIGRETDIIDRLDEIRSVGVDHVILNDMSGSPEALVRFAADIAPHVSGSSSSLDRPAMQAAVSG